MIFAFLKTLSRLFRFAENVKCRQIFQEFISWGPYSNSEGERKIRRRLFTSPTKRAIRHFHVVVVQWQQRNVPKSSSRCRRRRRRRRRCLSSLIGKTQMKNLAYFCVRYKLIMFSFYRARNVKVMCKVFKTRDQGEARTPNHFPLPRHCTRDCDFRPATATLDPRSRLWTRDPRPATISQTR